MTSPDCRLFIVLSGVSFSVQPNHRSACSMSVFASRFALHPALHTTLYWSVGSLHAFANARMRPHVQMACPKRAIPMAWRAFVGRSATQDAAPPRHRIPVPSGRGKMQGKIKGRGTAWRQERVCTWGWRGTPILTAPCRWLHQSRIGIDEAACLLRCHVMGLDGVTP
jgi:hypothetical protein